MVKLLNHYVLFYIKWVNSLNILERTKKHVIFGWWWCDFEIQQKLEKKKVVSVEFDNQPVYNEKYIKTRVKTFEDKVMTKFTNNKIWKENTLYSCVAKKNNCC